MATDRYNAGQTEASDQVRRLGRWVLGQELGRGSFGAVFLARAEGVDQPVALKVLTRVGGLDAEDVARFEQEASIAARLDHPGLVRVIEVGRGPTGLPWMAMEYCPGPTLAQRLKEEGHLPPGEAAAIVADLARTIAHAHQQGIIHRDLKPSNVILDQRVGGRPRITDFGLARDTFLGRSLTATGEALGSPYYMSPEQVQARKDVDQRSDVWALGVILYQCLCGQRPFEGKNSFIIARAILGGPVPPPSHHQPGIPPHLDAVCMRALEREREARYAVADEMALALERVPATLDPDRPGGTLPGLGLDAHWLKPTGAPRGRRLRLAAAVAAAVLVGGVVGAVAVIQGQAAARARRQAAVEERLRAASTRSAALDPLDRAFEACADAETLAAGDPLLLARVRLARADLLACAGRGEEAAPILEELGRRSDRIGLEARWLRIDALEDREDPEVWRELDALAAADLDGPIGLAAAARLDPSLEGGLVRARELDPAAWQVTLVSASCRAEQGALDEAAAELDLLAKERPHDPRGWRLRARLAALRRDGPGEKSALERALALCRDEPPTWLRLARARTRLDADDPELAGDLDALLALHPGHPASLMLRAAADWRARRHPEAIQAWRELLLRDPDAFLVQVAAFGTCQVDFETSEGGIARAPLGILMSVLARWTPGPLANGVTPQLELRLRARARAAPEPARAPLTEALVLAAGGAPWPEVAPHLERAMAAAPRDPVVALSAARLLCGRDRHVEAERALETALELCPWARAELLRLRGEAALRRGSPRRALAALAEADRYRPDGPDGLVAATLSDWLTPYWGDAPDPTASPEEDPPDEGRRERTDRDYRSSWGRMRERAIRAVAGYPEHARALALAGAAHRRDSAQFAAALIEVAIRREGQVDAQLLTWRAEAVAEVRRNGPDGEGPREPLLDQELPHAWRLSDGGIHRWQPMLRTAMRWRGRWGRRGDPAWAERLIDSALQLDPEQGIAHLLKGALLLRRKAPKDEVLRAWARARELDPGPLPATLVEEFREAHGVDPP